MKQHLLDYVRKLSAEDKKTLSEKTLKLGEEFGELAKAALPYDGAHCTTHRFVERFRILEESVDSTLCALSIAYSLGFSDDDFEEMFVRKLKYWGELQHRESKARYPVPYEIHITVEKADKEKFKEACKELNVKPIILDLQDQKGNNILYDIMTSSTFIGDNPGAYKETRRIVDGLCRMGFKVIREKIETVPWHPAAPSDDHVTPIMPKHCYFETHFNIVTSDDRKGQLSALAKEFGAHLSRNAFKRIDEENYTIIMTYRSHQGTYEEFKTKIDKMSAKIKENGFELEKVMIEFSLYDTKVDHDAKWLVSEHSAGNI